MSHPQPRHTPPRYQFRLGERLDAHWSSWFDDLDLTHEGDGTTSLTGPVRDQAEGLHGMLARFETSASPSSASACSTRSTDRPPW